KLSESRSIELLRPLAEKGVSIVFEAPKPVFRSPAFRCSDWFNASNPSCKDGVQIEREFMERLRAPVLDNFRSLQEAMPNIHVWDSFPYLCPDSEICSPFHADGNPLFFDGDHVSGYGNNFLTSPFVHTIKPLLGR